VHANNNNALDILPSVVGVTSVQANPAWEIGANVPSFLLATRLSVLVETTIDIAERAQGRGSDALCGSWEERTGRAIKGGGERGDEKVGLLGGCLWWVGKG
jgi:hypothetical protein